MSNTYHVIPAKAGTQTLDVREMMISIAELFAAAELTSMGPIPWGQPIPEKNSGVYVITQNLDHIIYIGRTSQPINKRIQQFYRHKYGAKSPHRGGQEILQLNIPKYIYWSPTEDFRSAESIMIARFEKHENQKPFGNKKRGDRLHPKP